ncbi:hypothetical protein LT85_3731 [Collimonas arenae]|uniref:DUF11 domain-containing protein n=1 Tax=Collimonas arenae TaxID=279058 RepID=A0A0A1FGZ8_9BURK|nr:hypothetical protein LT85_3731 [Collimonas arenae]
MGFFLGTPTAFAAAPPANTVIGNQASASYSDPNGNTQLATSNLVQTTVQQVGSFLLDTVNQVTTTVINTKTGAAGTTVYAPHTLTNTGNGADGFNITVTIPAGANPFTQVQVFADANGDGIPDSTTPLCTALPGGTCTVPTQTVAGNNGVYQFVVAYTIPGTATTPTTPYSTGTVTATPVTTALYTAPNTQAADVDNVNLTTTAAFNASKSISVPAVAAPGGGAWPTAVASGPSSSSAACPTTYAAGMTSTASCQYTVYTLNFSNTGGAAGAFALSDKLPAGFTYVANSAVWSNAPGTALGDGAGGDPVGIDYQSTGGAGATITAVVKSLAPNVSQTISFVVLVNNTAAVGTSTTTNTAAYNPVDAGATATAASPGPTGSNTNPAIYTVTASYGIAVGTNLPTVATATTALDVTPGAGDGSADLTTRPSVIAGGSVQFPQIVFNTGNATDTVNLTAALGTFPAGTTFTFFAADGKTPLLDTSGDGIVDTGPIAAGGSVAIVVQANIPASATVGSGPFTALITGKSVGNPAKVDATKDTVTTVIGSLVDLTNTAAGTGVGSIGNGDLGPGPSPLPTTTNTTVAGTGTIFTLFVKNNDSTANSYNLAASQSTSFPGTLPTGWTVKFVAAGATCSGAAITATPTIAAGAQLEVDACVTPPASQAAVTAQKVYFQVLSTAVASTGVLVSDAKTDAVTVTVAAAYSATLTPNNSGQVAPGGTVVYAHTLTNTGNQSCGAYTLAAVLPAADVTAGWTAVVYLDVNGTGQIAANDPIVTSGQNQPALGAAGATQKLLVKVFAPGGATAGASDLVTITSTFTDPAPNCGTQTATDTTTVITGQIRVVKTQALDAACAGTASSFSTAPLTAKPGNCIIYQVVATNQGTAPISNMIVNDAVPAYTALAATQPATKCVSTGTTPVLANANYTVNGTTAVSCGTATTVNPGGSATLTFQVQINQ